MKGIISFVLFMVLQSCRELAALKCYTCDNEHSNVHCVGDFNLHTCEDGFDTCQTIVAYSDVIEKLSIIKTCTKNSSCYLQKAEKQMTKDLQVTCDNRDRNWICTDCCYEDACNINGSTKSRQCTIYIIIFCYVLFFIMYNDWFLFIGV